MEKAYKGIPQNKNIFDFLGGNLPDSVLEPDDDMLMESAFRFTSNIVDIKENGIPDISSLLYFVFCDLMNIIRSADEDLTDFELDYLKKHLSDNDYHVLYNFRSIVPCGGARDVLTEIFLNKLLYDFKQGNSEGKEILRALLEKFFKEKYKRLKKYNFIDIRILVNDGFISEPETDTSDHDHLTEIAIIMAMAMVLDIKISEDLYSTIFLMNELYTEELDGLDKFRFHAAKLPPNVQESNDKYIDDDEFLPEPDTRINKMLARAVRAFYRMNNMFSYFGLCSKTGLDPYDIADELVDFDAYGIDISKLDKKDLTYLAWIFKLLGEYTGYAAETDDILRRTLHSNYEGLEYGFEKMQLKINKAAAGRKNDKPLVQKVIEDKGIELKNSDLLEEMEELKSKLAAAQSDVLRQRELYEQARHENQILRKEADRVPALTSELAALREYAYNNTESNHPEQPEPSREDMLKFLNTKHCVVVGGDDRWVGKLKQLMPGWRYAAPHEEGSIPVSIADGADRVFMFTEHICHSQYGRYLSFIRTNRIPLSYVDTVNIDKNISAFYKALM